MWFDRLGKDIRLFFRFLVKGLLASLLLSLMNGTDGNCDQALLHVRTPWFDGYGVRQKNKAVETTFPGTPPPGSDWFSDLWSGGLSEGSYMARQR